MSESSSMSPIPVAARRCGNARWWVLGEVRTEQTNGRAWPLGPTTPHRAGGSRHRAGNASRGEACALRRGPDQRFGAEADRRSVGQGIRRIENHLVLRAEARDHLDLVAIVAADLDRDELRLAVANERDARS